MIIYAVLWVLRPILWLVRQIVKVIRGRQGQGPSKFEDGYWENRLGKQFAISRRFAKPESREALVQIVAEATGLRVRAVGSGHSFAECAIADGVRLDMHGLNRVLRVDHARMRVRVEAGITIR